MPLTLILFYVFQTNLFRRVYADYTQFRVPVKTIGILLPPSSFSLESGGGKPTRLAKPLFKAS